MHYIDAFMKAKLEKQIRDAPLKPVKKGSLYWLCAECGHVLHEDDNYCSICGTRIDWRDL